MSTVNSNNDNQIELEVGPRDKRDCRLVIAMVGGEERHRDRFCTDRADPRRKFLRDLAAKIGEGADALAHLDNTIVQRADTVDEVESQALRDAAACVADETAPNPADDTPPEVQEAAMRYLQNPRLMKELERDAQGLGVVGEWPLVAILYCVAVSRKLAQPLGAVVQAASSSGKSYVMNAVLSLTPPEDVIKATDLTPQALFYFEPGRLEHKLVAVAERQHFDSRDEASAGNATLALREMLSEGELVKIVTVKMEGGMQTAEIRQQGPIAFVQTTTQEQIFAEDETRLLPLVTDESPRQTERILRYHARRAAGTGEDAEEGQRIRAKHQAAQRLLRTLDVRIGYAQHLTIPSTKVSARRAFGQLLGVIAAVALLRQYQKEEHDGCIDADLVDYEIAYGLMLPVLRRMFAPLSSRARDLFDRIRDGLRERAAQQRNRPNLMLGGGACGAETFARKDCQRWSGVSLTEARNRLHGLVEAGLVQVIAGERGVPYRYRLTADVPPDQICIEGLITPDELRTRLAAEAAESLPTGCDSPPPLAAPQDLVPSSAEAAT